MDEKTEYASTPEQGEGVYLDIRAAILAFEQAALGSAAEKALIIKAAAEQGLMAGSIWHDLATLTMSEQNIGGITGSERARLLTAELRQELSDLYHKGVQDEGGLIAGIIAERPSLYVDQATQQPITAASVTVDAKDMAQLTWHLGNGTEKTGVLRGIAMDESLLGAEEQEAIEGYRQRNELS